MSAFRQSGLGNVFSSGGGGGGLVVVVEGERRGRRGSVDVGGSAQPLTVAGPPNNDGCCVTVTECRVDWMFLFFFFYSEQEGRGDVMSV